MTQAVAKFAYEARSEDDLSFAKGDTITILQENPSGIWFGRDQTGKEGTFPCNYVEKIKSGSSASKTTSDSRRSDLLARALYDFEAQDEDQLSFSKGDTIRVLTKEGTGWWRGENVDGGSRGIFPSNFVQLIEAEAKALYDYKPDNAVNQQLLTFHKGDTITVFKKDASGWWSGEANGRMGLFPASYITLDGQPPLPSTQVPPTANSASSRDRLPKVSMSSTECTEQPSSSGTTTSTQPIVPPQMTPSPPSNIADDSISPTVSGGPQLIVRVHSFSDPSQGWSVLLEATTTAEQVCEEISKQMGTAANGAAKKEYMLFEVVSGKERQFVDREKVLPTVQQQLEAVRRGGIAAGEYKLFFKEKPSGKQLVRVFLQSNPHTYWTLSANAATTAQFICQTIAEKLALPLNSFHLVEVAPEHPAGRQTDPCELVLDIKGRWPPGSTAHKFLLREKTYEEKREEEERLRKKLVEEEVAKSRRLLEKRQEEEWRRMEELEASRKRVEEELIASKKLMEEQRRALAEERRKAEKLQLELQALKRQADAERIERERERAERERIENEMKYAMAQLHKEKVSRIEIPTQESTREKEPPVENSKPPNSEPATTQPVATGNLIGSLPPNTVSPRDAATAKSPKADQRPALGSDEAATQQRVSLIDKLEAERRREVEEKVRRFQEEKRRLTEELEAQKRTDEARRETRRRQLEEERRRIEEERRKREEEHQQRRRAEQERLLKMKADTTVRFADLTASHRRFQEELEELQKRSEESKRRFEAELEASRQKIRESFAFGRPFLDS